MVPLLSDLYEYLDKMDANSIPIHFEYEKSQPALPLAHLMCIVPRVSMDLLPKKLKDKILGPDSNIRKFYPIDYEI